MPATKSANRLNASIDSQRVWDQGYELLELAASLSCHDVWRIRDRVTYEVFLWKQIRPEWSDHPSARTALENEVAVSRLVPSPFLLRLKEAHLNSSPRYVVWEAFEGLSVEGLWRQYRILPVRSALWIVRQCAQGLHDLLRGGLLHGKLHPANILVNPKSGQVKLTDLSSARRVPAETGGENLLNGPHTRFHSTATQFAEDTFQPPPPLQGLASDLHQLGIILFRSLAGRMPFRGDSAADMLRSDGNAAEDLRRCCPDLDGSIIEIAADLLSRQGPRELQHPATLINRLMEQEVTELVKLRID